MDKSLLLAALVFGCAILMFFSQEFANTFKKIMAIRGMKLFLPLILVTYLVLSFQAELVWALTKIQALLFTLIAFLAKLFPFNGLANVIASVLVLMALTFLPVLAIDFWIKRKTYHGFNQASLTSLFIWLFVALLLSVESFYG